MILLSRATLRKVRRCFLFSREKNNIKTFPLLVFVLTNWRPLEPFYDIYHGSAWRDSV